MSVEVKNVTFGYETGDEVIDDLSVTFMDGEFTAVLGPNGSGKSTLMKIILGILNMEKGSIKTDGRDLKGLDKREMALLFSYVPQISDSDYGFTVEETVFMGRYIHRERFKSPSPVDFKVTEESMKKAGVYFLKDKKITEISGGERQRVSLARAFCQDSKYIILDEPVNHLDVRYQTDVLKSLRESVPEKTVIAVMHDINLTSMFSDNSVLINKGKIVASGRTKDILTAENLKEVFETDFKILKDGDRKFFIPEIKN